MRRECQERFPRHRLQRKPLVSDPGMHHGTSVTHVPWCILGSLIRGGGENIPGIPDACATPNFAYLVRGPLAELIHRMVGDEYTVVKHSYDAWSQRQWNNPEECGYIIYKYPLRTIKKRKAGQAAEIFKVIYSPKLENGHDANFVVTDDSGCRHDCNIWSRQWRQSGYHGKPRFSEVNLRTCSPWWPRF